MAAESFWAEAATVPEQGANRVNTSIDAILQTTGPSGACSPVVYLFPEIIVNLVIFTSHPACFTGEWAFGPQKRRHGGLSAGGLVVAPVSDRAFFARACNRVT